MTDAVTKVARNLTEIENLTASLPAQAAHKAADRLMPGGMAMVMLGPDADLDEWAEQIAYAELRHYATCEKDSHKGCTVAGAEHVEDEDDQWTEDPLRTLLFWTDEWRERHGYPLEGREATIVGEVKFLRWCLNWAWENEPHFEDFADDVHQVRLRLESALLAGRRAERSRVRCPNPECENKPRLILVRARRHAARDADLLEQVATIQTEDHWKCTACKTRYDADAYRRAYGQQLRSQGAERYVPFRDALATLRDQGRPERTVRKWVIDGEVDAYCDRSTRRLMVWWPDLWRLHLATQTRNRRSA